MLNLQIKVDDTDIQYVDQQSLSQQIGIVPQEPVLFNTTIYENIAYGCKTAKKWNVEKAAQIANAHDFISQLPDGYETVTGEGGVQLSGGQKQRIAIARALVGNPKILVLDEATSALDKENESVIEQAMNQAMQGRTTVIIAHKLSTIEKADLIIGIDNGRVIEAGNHAELLEKKGLYHALMSRQIQIRGEDDTEESLKLKSMQRKSALQDELKHVSMKDDSNKV